MSSQPNDFSASLTSLRCPSCGIMVRMPAETCPSCKANMRTGLRPEVAEKFTFWHRRWGKVLAVFLLLVGPPLAYGLGYGNLLDLLRSGLAKVGLSSCAEPLNRWDTFNQDEFDQAVRAGYLNWRGNKTFRKLGESPQGPESPLMASRTREQKLQYLDSRTFFASSFMADRPALSLKPENNWYLTLNGEWDIAWIQGKDTPEEKIVAGEWVFSWINDGDALQDVMSIPFRWLKLPAGQMPIFITTIRHFNESRSAWEGFHVQNRQMYYFGAASSQNQVVETYQIENGPIMAWVFSDMLPDSFQVTIRQSLDNGTTYQEVGQIWAKKRTYAAEP